MHLQIDEIIGVVYNLVDKIVIYSSMSHIIFYILTFLPSEVLLLKEFDELGKMHIY